MQKLHRLFRVLDYLVAFATIGYGLFSGNIWIAALGVAGLVLAYLNLSDRISALLRRKLMRKSPVSVRVEEAMPIQSVMAEQAPLAAKSYGAPTGLSIGQTVASASRHNVLLNGSPQNYSAS